VVVPDHSHVLSDVRFGVSGDNAGGSARMLARFDGRSDEVTRTETSHVTFDVAAWWRPGAAGDAVRFDLRAIAAMDRFADGVPYASFEVEDELYTANVTALRLSLLPGVVMAPNDRLSIRLAAGAGCRTSASRTTPA